MWNTGLHTGYVPQIVFLQTDESLRIFISEKLPLYDAFLYSLVADLIIHKMLLQLFLFTTTYSSNLLMSLCQLFGDNLWSSLWLLGHAQKQYCVLCHPAQQWIVAVLSDALISVYLQLPKGCLVWHQHVSTPLITLPYRPDHTNSCFSTAAQAVSGSFKLQV